MGRIAKDSINFFCQKLAPEIIKVGIVTINVLSIGIKFENFMQAGCRDQSGCTVYCQKPIILPKLVLFFETSLELPVLPSFICGKSNFKVFPTRRIGSRLGSSQTFYVFHPHQIDQLERHASRRNLELPFY